MKNQTIMKRLEKIFIILVFLISYFAVIYHPQDPVFIGEFNNKDGSLYVVRLVDVVVSLILFFIVIFWFIPCQLLKNRYLIFTLSTFVVVGTVSIIEYGLDRIILHLFNLPTSVNEISDKMLNNPRRDLYYSTIIPGNLMVYILALFYGLSRDWFVKIRKQNELQKEKMQANIAFLRSQVNPHFFFNALNNIYAITRKKRDEETGRAIMKLSAVMRYMIYDSNVEKISLDKEIEHIKQYMDLIRLKFDPDDPLQLQLDVDGDLENYHIAPLILLPFVENACKHGLSATGNGYLQIDIDVKDQQLLFQVKNSIYSAQREMIKKHPGIGLENVKKRLQLLYPNQHKLQIEKTEDMFTIILTIHFEES